MTPLPHVIMGMPVRYVRAHLVVERKWRERLFSWPWRPWQADKLVPNPAAPPKGQVYVIGGQFSPFGLVAPGPSQTMLIREDDIELVRQLRREL